MLKFLKRDVTKIKMYKKMAAQRKSIWVEKQPMR